MPTRAIVAGGLIVAVFALYFQVGDHEFVGYDDVPYIVENPTVHASLTPSSLWRTFSEPEHANWIPLTTLSLQLNHAVHALAPGGYLLTNVALHAATSVLLFLLLSSLTGATWRSGFVAAVFALHPLHVESVAWASERKDVLCAFFFVLTLIAYARFVTQRSLVNYALVLWCLVAALLAKPMAVTLPFVLLLLDFWPLERLRSDIARVWPEGRILVGAVVEKLPLFVLAIAASVVTFTVQGEGGNFSYTSGLGFEARFANVATSYVAYLADSFWPSGLAVFYPVPIHPPSRWGVAGAVVLLLGLTALAFRAGSQRPYLLVGWLWFVGMLVPVIGLVHVGMQARADRYMYLPQIGLAIAFAWGATDWLGARRSGRRALAAAGSVVLCALAVVTWNQIGHWRDSIALFSRAVAVTEDNQLAHFNLAAALGQADRVEEARVHQEIAQDIMVRGELARMERAGR